MKRLLRFINRLCRVFTLTAMAFMLVNVASGTVTSETAIRVTAFLLLFPFALLYTLAAEVYRFRKLPFALRLATHCVLVCGGAYCLLYLPVAASAGSTKLLMLLVFLLLYWLCMAVYLFASRKTKKNRQSKDTPVYQNRFLK